MIALRSIPARAFCIGCDPRTNLLVDALVVVELDPEILVDASLPDRMVVLKVNVDYLE